jgi:hypothetical protein
MQRSAAHRKSTNCLVHAIFFQFLVKFLRAQHQENLNLVAEAAGDNSVLNAVFYCKVVHCSVLAGALHEACADCEENAGIAGFTTDVCYISKQLFTSFR